MNIYLANITKHLNLELKKISHFENLGEIENTFQIHESEQRIQLTNDQSNDDLSL